MQSEKAVCRKRAREEVAPLRARARPRRLAGDKALSSQPSIIVAASETTKPMYRPISIEGASNRKSPDRSHITQAKRDLHCPLTGKHPCTSA